MQFIKNGMDIPNDLLSEVNARKVVFLCGAGVSRKAGLPDFKKLVEKIYEELGENPSGNFSEKKAFDSGEYDRTLGALERRRGEGNIPSSELRRKVAEVLSPPSNPDLSGHRALLELSRDSEDRPRLLTTNFDTLFEHAAAQYPKIEAASYAGKALPKPGGVHDHGILHLHGRITDEALGLKGSDLVLTSADFGDAYLRDGWASRYFEDFLRIHTLVLVGYSAEDAALRLLLETLDVDRARFKDLKSIYAIDTKHDSARELWAAKGIKFIGCLCYNELYQTLGEWANYVKSPVNYTEQRLKEIWGANDKRKKYDEATPLEKEQVRFFFSTIDWGEKLAEMNPCLSWLKLFLEEVTEEENLNIKSREKHNSEKKEQKNFKKNISYNGFYIIPWIIQNMSDIESLKYFILYLPPLEGRSIDNLEFELNKREKTLSRDFIKAWRCIIMHIRNKPLLQRYDLLFKLKPRLHDAEDSAELFQRLASILRPKLYISPRDNREPFQKANEVFSIDYTVIECFTSEEILKTWPKKSLPAADARLLHYLISSCNEALDEAHDFKEFFDYNRYKLFEDGVPSLASHEQNGGSSSFLTIARVIAEIWTRLADKDIGLALPFIDEWSKSPFRLNRRFALHACTHTKVNPSYVSMVLAATPQEEFFRTGAAREVYCLLCARWSDLSSPEKETLAHRICQGLPPTLLPHDEHRDEYADRPRFNLLSFMEYKGLTLTPAMEAELAAIRKRWPEWKPPPPERAGFMSFIESYYEKTSEAPSIEELSAKAESGIWQVREWNKFLWNRELEQTEYIAKVAACLHAAPRDILDKISDAASWWLSKHSSRLLEKPFWNLWDLLLTALPDEEEQEDMLTVTQALNRPLGYLVESIFSRSKQLSESQDIRLSPEETRPRFNHLLELSGGRREIALVLLARHIVPLHNYDASWTNQALIPLFDWKKPEALMLWFARRYTSLGPPELFNSLKPSFLDFFNQSNMPTSLLDHFGGWIAYVMMRNKTVEFGQYSLDKFEAREALRQGGETTLPGVAAALWRGMEQAPISERAEFWKRVVGRTFDEIWPRDHGLQTSKPAFSLLSMLLITGDAFDEAVDAVIPFLRPAKESGLVVSKIREADDLIFSKWPEKLLTLLKIIVGDQETGSISGLREVLDKIADKKPALMDTGRFQNLLFYAG